jgi:hypothetical protein
MTSSTRQDDTVCHRYWEGRRLGCTLTWTGSATFSPRRTGQEREWGCGRSSGGSLAVFCNAPPLCGGTSKVNLCFSFFLVAQAPLPTSPPLLSLPLSSSLAQSFARWTTAQSPARAPSGPPHPLLASPPSPSVPSSSPLLSPVSPSLLVLPLPCHPSPPAPPSRRTTPSRGSKPSPAKRAVLPLSLEGSKVNLHRSTRLAGRGRASTRGRSSTVRSAGTSRRVWRASTSRTLFSVGRRTGRLAGRRASVCTSIRLLLFSLVRRHLSCSVSAFLPDPVVLFRSMQQRERPDFHRWLQSSPSRGPYLSQTVS